MNIPIDYNKMQKELDRRHYMQEVFDGKTTYWQTTELGLKTYSRFCDLVGWEQKYNGRIYGATDEFLNLAIKRNWAVRIYSIEQKRNIIMQTQFGHDLFRTFEYWIDEKAQKKAKQKETMQKVAKGGMKFMAVTLPQIIQGITQIMAGLSKGMSSLDYQRTEKKSKPKTKKRGKKKPTKTNKPKDQPSDNFSVNDPSWNNWSNAGNSNRKGNWWEI